MLVLSQSLRSEQRLTQRCTQRQSLEQRLVRNVVIRARVECPACDRVVDPDRERAWSQDPHDYHVTCPSCGTRFIAALEVETRHSRQENRDGTVRLPNISVHAFLCPVQTAQALIEIRSARSSKRWPGLRSLHHDRPEVLYSAIRHFGDLRAAIVAAATRLDRQTAEARQ